MKQYVAQQRTDFKAAKALFKRHLEEDTSLSNVQRKQLLEDRKRELQQQQKVNEEEHLQKFKIQAAKKKVEFQQKVMQDRQSFEKDLLQQVRFPSFRVVTSDIVLVQGESCR